MVEEDVSPVVIRQMGRALGSLREIQVKELKINDLERNMQMT